MKENNLIDKSINTISDISNSISSKYDNHLKEKAIKKVDEKLLLHKLKVEDIEQDDYEAMISDAISEIKKDYATKTAQIALGALGLDILFGL